jgi:hypothetical protein
VADREGKTPALAVPALIANRGSGAIGQGDYDRSTRPKRKAGEAVGKAAELLKWREAIPEKYAN